MIKNYIQITKTSHILYHYQSAQNKTHLYLCQQQHPDSKHMKEEENKSEKGSFVTQTVFFISTINQKLFCPKICPPPISGGNIYAKQS